MIRKAFTLIELMVVIAIIGGLIAVVVPALQYSKHKAQSVVCASNLGQLAVLLNTYAHFQNTYPPGFCNLPSYSSPPGGYTGNPSYDRMGWRWFHFILENNISSSMVKKMVSCPSSKTKDNAKLTVLCGNVGINYSICKIATLTTRDEFHGPALSPTAIRRPSQVLLLMDAGYTMMSWKAASLFEAGSTDTDLESRKSASYVPGLSINPQKIIHPDLNNDAVKGRHLNQRLNTILADGSAKKRYVEDLLIETENPLNSPAYFIWSPLNKR